VIPSLQLDADLQDRQWSPSAPPEGFTAPRSGLGTSGSRPSSAQGLRKSRASARTSTGLASRTDSASPSLSYSNPASPDSNDGIPTDQKAANEAYFSSLGSLNSSRPDDLPPSLGGRYQGFGNTPDPPADSQHPSYGLTSRDAPSLSELQENPMAALSKGWSLFSSAVVGASRAVSENVIQPGVERVTDPTLHATVRGYVGEAGRRAGEVGSSVNQWGKTQLGVDVAEQLGGVVDSVRDTVGGPARSGYSSVYAGGSREVETSALYDHDDDDFFSEYHGTGDRHSETTSAPGTKATGERGKRSGGWDEEDWKEF
jgi:ADP-ribosylation factor GTPase-activating protein 1